MKFHNTCHTSLHLTLPLECLPSKLLTTTAWWGLLPSLSGWGQLRSPLWNLFFWAPHGCLSPFPHPHPLLLPPPTPIVGSTALHATATCGRHLNPFWIRKSCMYVHLSYWSPQQDLEGNPGLFNGTSFSVELWPSEFGYMIPLDSL